jgi:hypothetical protein
MANWKSHLRADPTDWLMDADNQSVRYFTLVDILGRSREDHDVTVARKKIMETGPVPKILSGQQEGGYWGKPEDFYERSKYKGTTWTLNLLAELGADGNDEHIRKSCEFILWYSQDRESGGFSHVGMKSHGGDHDKILPCLTGNMVFSLVRFGYLDDPRVQRAINWLTTYMRFDDGTNEPPEGWPYRYDKCWGGHTCHMGVIKTLKALLEIPRDMRSADVKKTLKSGGEYFLKHRVHKKSHNPMEVSIREWLDFGFPLFWKSDSLEVLNVLLQTGHRDERMQEAVDLVLSKQDDDGRWSLDSSFNNRMQVNIERKGRPSRWITLNAVKAIKNFYS